MPAMPRAAWAAWAAHRHQLAKRGSTMRGCFDRRNRAAAAALIFALFGQSTAAMAYGDLPDLGDAAQSMVTPQDERRLGEQSMLQLRASGGYFDDPEVNAYLAAIGQRLVAGLTVSHPEFTFFAVPSPEINAFAMPGGFIGVNTGLILAARSESELASVLAHEITHVTQHHIARQLAAGANTQMVAMAALLATLVAAHSGNGQLASAAISTTMAAQAQSQINYTREHEREADRIGFALLEQAGFDNRAMAGFFERLQQVSRGQESSTSTPSYLRSHPMTYERVADAQGRESGVPYRQIADSPDFHFVRALLRSYDGRPEEAVSDFTSRLAEKRYQHRDAARYGLAAALLRAKEFPAALKALEELEREGVRHPMIEAMAGQVLQQAGQYPAALHHYEKALARYPAHLQLVHDYPRTLLLDHRYGELVRFVEKMLTTHRDDAALHQMAAEAYAALGNAARSHRHQGEYYAAIGDNLGAIEQLELARRTDSGKEADTYQLLLIETRLKTLRDKQFQPAGGAVSGGGGLASLTPQEKMTR